MSKHKKGVLIYRLGSLGDTVVALPCFHKVRESFPDADITLLTNRPVATKAAAIEAVLGGKYFFDRVLSYPVGTRDPRVMANLISQIRSLGISTVVNLTAARTKMSAYRDHLFFRAAGAKQLIGFPSVREDFEVCIDPTTGSYEWEAKRLTRRIGVLGDIPLDVDTYWNLHLTDEELQTADKLLDITSFRAPTVAVSIGTKLQPNDWGTDNWINLLSQLKTELDGWRLVLIGAAEERAVSNTLLEAWGGMGLNLCGQASPRVSAAILKHTNVFIGHDSGPMHLAACVGTPCVAVFSARGVPHQWYPRGESNRIIYHKPECAGCGLQICVEQKKKCILSITVNEVQQAVMDVVNNAKIQI